MKKENNIKRRSFLKQVGTVSVLSGIPFASIAVSKVALNNAAENKLQIGIIGAENSHTIAFGKLFNIDKKFPGIEVKYVWGETKEFAEKAKEKGSIPNIVNVPEDMLGKIDALIVDHRHAKYHLKAALPFIKRGVPTFIDKPFCYRLADGIEFLKTARKYGTPVTSFSSVANSQTTLDYKNQVKNLGKYKNVVCYCPADLHSEYGGIFYYGVHAVQQMMNIFGEEIKKVKVTPVGSKGSATLLYEDGSFITLIFRKLSYGWDTYVETDNGIVELVPNSENADPEIHYTKMVDMFLTGKEPRTYSSILKCVAVLEALEKSSKTENWEPVEEFSI